jgi:hypothetical protein
VLVLAAGLAGCGTASGGAPAGTHLTATLVSPTDVKLSWTGGEPDAAGRVVEFATEPDGRYTVLQFVPAGQTSYTHADLMPRTTFYYRVRPYVGPASAPVEVRLPPGPVDENAPQGDQPWAAPQRLPQPAVPQRSVRAPGAVPTDLAASVMPAGGVRFTWTDHASDEDGYLLEVRAAAGADWTVAQLLDPDVNSVGRLAPPDERSAAFRVRAFSYGPPSNVVHQHTG